MTDFQYISFCLEEMEEKKEERTIWPLWILFIVNLGLAGGAIFLAYQSLLVSAYI